MDFSKNNSIKDNKNMDLDFFTDEKLLLYFCHNKTKISTLENPLMFLRHLKDNRLITDELVRKLECSSNESDIYKMLESIEKRGKKNVRKFWQCVNQEHLLERYGHLSEIVDELKKDFESLVKESTEDRSKGEERKIKKRRIERSSASNQAGPSSQSTHSHYTAQHVETGHQSSPDSSTDEPCNSSSSHQSSPDSSTDEPCNSSSKKLWDMPKHKRWLPVTCGNEKALLDREALFERKKLCIKHKGEIIFPWTFTKRGGKEASKSWKTSILCEGKTLSSLIELDILKTPECQGKFTLRN